MGLGKWGEFHAVADRQSPLCVGIDPSAELLRSWGLAYDVHGLSEFCNRMLEAMEGRAGICKLQAAFFEALGPDGMRVLQRFVKAAQDSGIIVIADAKRGDVDHVVKAYAAAWLGAGSPMAVDAVTVHPWFGFQSLAPMFERAALSGALVFVVVRPSNLRSAIDSGFGAQAGLLADRIAAANAQATHFGNAAAVVGSTISDYYETASRLKNTLLLSPGIGAQGATLDDLHRRAKECSRRVIPAISRSILGAGPSLDALKKAVSHAAGDALRLRT